MVNYLQISQDKKPARTYNTQVIYSLHCFTRGKKDEDSNKSLYYSDLRECRVFDFLRYELSKQLPEIIESLINRQCYHTGKGNFLVVEILNKNGDRYNYEIYFKLNRSPKGILTLHIQSAYSKPIHESNPKKKKIGFHVILFNTSIDKPIKQPK